MIVFLPAIQPLAAQNVGNTVVRDDNSREKDEGIVVIGEREKETLQKAKKFVAEIARTSDDQLSRFKKPVCPAVVGLPDATAAWIEQRIKNIAEEIGPGQDDADCSANLVVIATDDVPGLFRDISKHRRRWLTGLSDYERKDLETSNGPVIAWAATSLRNEDGQQASTQYNVNQGGSGTDQFSKLLRVKSASIFRLTRELYIDGTIILIDRRALLDRSTLQVADYFAVRGLVQAQAPENPEFETILSAFEPGVSNAPERISEADYAFIRALYSGNGRKSAVQERARIAKAVADFVR